jgi:hypothetical protein
MDAFKNISYDFYNSELYNNHKGEVILMFLTTNSIYFVDISRREIRAILRYSEISDIQLESNEKIKINYKNEMDGV